MRKYGALIVVLLALCGCKKPEDRKCWKGAGDDDSLVVVLPDFKQVFLGPHINFELVQDSSTFMVVRGGKNLINHVEAEMVDNMLEIKNQNKCSFLRSYKKKINVELHVDVLDKIHFEGSQPLYCKNQLVQDYLVLVIRDGAGRVNLNINANSLSTIVTNGWGNFDLYGSVNYLRVETNSSGFGTTEHIAISDSLHVVANSSELLKVKADNIVFRAQTKNFGDIWYTGHPSLLEFNQYGEGELLDKN